MGESVPSQCWRCASSRCASRINGRARSYEQRLRTAGCGAAYCEGVHRGPISTSELAFAIQKGDEEASLQCEELGMKVEGSEVWWSEPWREEDDDLAAMRDSPDDADAEPTSSSSLPNGESAAAVSVTQDSGAGDVSDGDGGSDSEGEGIGDEAEKKLEGQKASKRQRRKSAGAKPNRTKRTASLRRALQVHEQRASTPVSRIGAECTQNTALLSTFLHPPIDLQ